MSRRFALVSLVIPFFAMAAEYHVADVVELTNRVAKAANGDILYLAEGTYELEGTAGAYTSGHLNLGNGCTLRIRAEEGCPRERVVLKSNGRRHIYANKGFVELTGVTLDGGGATGGFQFGNLDAGFLLTNCVFRNCKATGSGGAIGTYTSGVTPPNKSRKAFHCAFLDNRSDGSGGAYNGVLAEFSYCVFTNNSAGGSAGAVYGGGRYSNCEFVNNVSKYTGSAAAGGGGAYSGPAVDTVFEDCLFVSNRVTSTSAYGGAIFWPGTGTSVCAFTNCTFAAQQAPSYAVIGYGKNATAGVFVECTFDGNQATNGPFGASGEFNRCRWTRNRMAVSAHAHMFAGNYKNCLFEANTNSATGNQSSLVYDGKIRNCTFIDNYLRNGERSIANTGVTLWNCVLANRTRDLYQQQLPRMTNCVWTSQSATNAAFEVALALVSAGGRLIANNRLKFSPEASYVPLYGSPLRDSGISDEDYLAEVGPQDLAGADRVAFGGIDIGCYECQKRPGLVLIFR